MSTSVGPGAWGRAWAHHHPNRGTGVSVGSPPSTRICVFGLFVSMFIALNVLFFPLWPMVDTRSIVRQTWIYNLSPTLPPPSNGLEKHHSMAGHIRSPILCCGSRSRICGPCRFGLSRNSLPGSQDLRWQLIYVVQKGSHLPQFRFLKTRLPPWHPTQTHSC